MVQKLRNAQVPVKQVQELTGISERTIGRIMQEPPVTTNDDTALRQVRKVGRRSTVAQYEAQIQQWLAEPRAPEDGPLRGIVSLTGSRIIVLVQCRSHLPAAVFPPSLSWRNHQLLCLAVLQFPLELSGHREDDALSRH